MALCCLPGQPHGFPPESKKMLMTCVFSFWCDFLSRMGLTLQNGASCHWHCDVPLMWNESRYNHTQHHYHTHDANILALKYAGHSLKNTMLAKKITKLTLENNLICNLTNKNYQVNQIAFRVGHGNFEIRNYSRVW